MENFIDDKSSEIEEDFDDTEELEDEEDSE